MTGDELAILFHTDWLLISVNVYRFYNFIWWWLVNYIGLFCPIDFTIYTDWLAIFRIDIHADRMDLRIYADRSPFYICFTSSITLSSGPHKGPFIRQCEFSRIVLLSLVIYTNYPHLTFFSNSITFSGLSQYQTVMIVLRTALYVDQWRIFLGCKFLIVWIKDGTL